MKTTLFLFLSLFLSLPAVAQPQLKILPTSLSQGQGFLAEILLDTMDPIYEALTFQVDAGTQKINVPLLRIEERKYRAYIGISADFPPGDHRLNIYYQGIVPPPTPSPLPISVEAVHESPQPSPVPSGLLIQQAFPVTAGKFSTQYITYKTPPLAPEVQAIIAQEEALVTQAKQTVSEKQLWQGAFILPVSHRVSSIYGNRRYLNGQYNGYHGGVDFASPLGTPIKAINGGKVLLARYFSKWNSNGNMVFLDHGHGVTSVYIHLSKIAVQEGQEVDKGTIIGHVGSTGRSTGPHLHWGVFLNGQNTDGLRWIRLSETFF